MNEFLKVTNKTSKISATFVKKTRKVSKQQTEFRHEKFYMNHLKPIKIIQIQSLG